MLNQTPSQQLEMLHGEFEPNEARRIVKNLYSDAINHYKLQKLKQWVGNHNVNTSVYDHMIADLKDQQNELNGLINTADKNNNLIAFRGKLSANLVA